MRSSATCAVGLALVLVVGACSSDDSPAATSPPASSSTTTTSTTTVVPTTVVPTTTTTAPACAAEEDVMACAQRAADAVEAPYTSSVKRSEPEDNNIVFAECLDTNDFDLDQLDASTETSFDADTMLNAQTMGSLEVRAFASEEVAIEAFAALEKVLGTDAGRQCFARQVGLSLGAPTQPTAELLEIEGAEVAARLTGQFGGSTFTVDFAAARSGSCTFFGSFQGLGEPFDATVISAMFLAALP